MNYDERYHAALNALKDPATASEGVAMMKEIAKCGDTRAMCDYGLMFITPTSRVMQNTEEALKWLLAAAEHSDDRGQFYVGKMYYDGKGVKQDYIQASKWFTLSAEKGYAIAQYYLGHMYLHGNGVPKDLDEALRWFTLSVDRECNEARVALGDILASDDYPAHDYKRAYMLYNAAKKDGYAPGYYKLGMMYFEGKGIPQNHIRASKLFREGSSDQLDNNDCLFMLGKMYYYGLGVEKSEARGLSYIRSAESKGSEEARDLLDEIDKTRKEQRGWNGATPMLIPVQNLKTPDLLYIEREDGTRQTETVQKKRRFSIFKR